MTAQTRQPGVAARPLGHHPIRPVDVGPQAFGGPRVPVVAPARTGADVVYADARGTDGGTAFDADGWARERADTPGALVVGIRGPGEAERYGAVADALVLDVGAESNPLVDDLAGLARTGLPVLFRGSLTVRPWTALVEAARAAGIADVIIVQGAGKSGALDLGSIGELRRSTGAPVIVEASPGGELAAPAVAGGADGLWFTAGVAVATVAAAMETAAIVAPLVRSLVPDSLPGLRTAIDGVDAALATLLQRRVDLAGRVQQLKPVGGHAGRDPDREAAIVHAMAGRAPSIDRTQLAHIMDAVISAGLDIAEREHPVDPPIWRL